MNAPAKPFLDGVFEALRPPPVLTLSQWADTFFYLSAESAAEPGRWHTISYQRGLMDAITDPSVTFVTVMKSARVGFTKCINAAIAYHIHHDPCPIMVVQPTVEDAEGYSKEEIAPMLRDCPVLAALVREPTTKVSGSTILAKNFPGGSLSMVGANSGRGFRRVSRRVVLLDEVDGYPASAGNEGDPVKLAIRRAEYYWNRKIIAGSTPLVAGTSRIAEMFEAGDQRRYHVPCPHCGHMDILCFSNKGERGHYMQWPDGEPSKAHFVCRACGCSIEEKDKRKMIDAGEWRADAEFKGHASFHVWTAYSLSPNASWGQIAEEFVDSKNKGVEQLKTFVNTVLGETWVEKGEAPEHERIYSRRETYAIGSVPEGVVMLTAGVDVQKDRFVYEVVGWGTTKESWSIDIGVLAGDTADEKTWHQLDDLLTRSYFNEKSQAFAIGLLAIDSGYNTQTVYNWARKYPMTRVIAVKGVADARVLIGTPTPVDVLAGGKKHQRGYRMWPVGGSIAKAEFYGQLRLETPAINEPFPAGFCHFPEYDPEYFKQITAEQLVQTRSSKGRVAFEWQVIPGRENHWLDARVYARAAASVKGLDRFVPVAGEPPRVATAAGPTMPPRPQQPQAEPRQAQPPRPQGKPGGWLGGGGRPGGGGWLGKRR